jgi:hypothetical protein
VKARRRQSDEYILLLHIFLLEKILFVADAYGKTRDIVFAFRIKTGHFRGFSADQCTACQHAAVCYAFYDLSHFFRFQYPCCQIVQKKQRLGALAQNIVYTHGHRILSDRVVLFCEKSQLQFRSYAIGSGHQHRFCHAG